MIILSEREKAARQRAYDAFDNSDPHVVEWLEIKEFKSPTSDVREYYADCFAGTRYLVPEEEIEVVGLLQQPDQILSDMAETFRERNAIYGDNYLKVGLVMEILHGVKAPHPAAVLIASGTAEQFNIWHLYELMIVKLTRFANSGLTHADSIHDLAVYAAMVESLVRRREP